MIGAGGNTFNEIRLQKSKRPIKTIRERNILSVISPVPFTVTVMKNGLVDVRTSGRNNSVVNATIEDIFPIEYVSFSSWGTTETKWFFDCDEDDQSDKLSQKAVSGLRTNIQKVVENIFSPAYDAISAPQNLSEISLDFLLEASDYDPKKVYATTRGKFQAVSSFEH